MDNWQRSLDNYITGGRYSKFTEDITCDKCGHKWEVQMYEEYGMCFYEDDDDSVCPKCGETKQ